MHKMKIMKILYAFIHQSRNRRERTEWNRATTRTCEGQFCSCLFIGKISEILTGAGGARFQLCTASLKQIHGKDMVRSGFAIHLTI